MPQDERFQKFADYFVKTYLDAGYDFLPNFWAKSPDPNPVTINMVASRIMHI